MAPLASLRYSLMSGRFSDRCRVSPLAVKLGKLAATLPHGQVLSSPV
jgi:hypothetical protein